MLSKLSSDINFKFQFSRDNDTVNQSYFKFFQENSQIQANLWDIRNVCVTDRILETELGSLSLHQCENYSSRKTSQSMDILSDHRVVHSTDHDKVRDDNCNVDFMYVIESDTGSGFILQQECAA